MAIPGSVVGVGKLVTPGGAQGPIGPTAVSSDPGNIATLGSDKLVLVPQSTIWNQRLRSYNSVGNPNFEVDQRHCGALVPAVGASQAVIDRWFPYGTGTMVASAQQINQFVYLPPANNFYITQYILRTTITTAQASLAAGDQWKWYQIIEGINYREMVGDVTSISILCRSSVANLKFGVALNDPSYVKSIVYLATIPSANIWTLVTLPNVPVIPGGGAFSTTAGNAGYVLQISLGVGSTSTAPSNGVWNAGNFCGAIGQSNFFANPVNSTFDIAFIQHEPGPLCTTFIDKPFSQNLDECLRYFAKSYDYSAKPGTASSNNGLLYFSLPASQNPFAPIAFKKTMAKASTVTAYAYDGTINSVRDVTASINKAVSGATLVGDAGFSGFGLSAAANVATWSAQFHYTADTGW